MLVMSLLVLGLGRGLSSAAGAPELKPRKLSPRLDFLGAATGAGFGAVVAAEQALASNGLFNFLAGLRTGPSV